MPQKGKKYGLERAYNKPKVVLINAKPPYGVREISPRLPAGQLKLWLSAFIDGVSECRYRR
jgi:hypothetical protein